MQTTETMVAGDRIAPVPTLLQEDQAAPLMMMSARDLVSMVVSEILSSSQVLMPGVQTSTWALALLGIMATTNTTDRTGIIAILIMAEVEVFSGITTTVGVVIIAG
jgi:hypothetical protein